MKEYLDYAESHADEILGTLRHMVELESFTADKASTDVLGGFIKERLEALGAQVRLAPQEEVGDHLVADLVEGAGGRDRRSHPGTGATIPQGCCLQDHRVQCPLLLVAG